MDAILAYGMPTTQDSSWKSKTSNEKLYNGTPKSTDIISEIMLHLA